MKRAALATLLVLLLLAPMLAPTVAAHGGRKTLTKSSESYDVAWVSYVFVVQSETLRYFWRTTEKASGDEVNMTGEEATFIYRDDSGNELDRETFTLEWKSAAAGDEPGAGVDLVMHAQALSYDASVTLPNGESVTFTDQEVQAEQTGGNGGDGGGDNGVPLPGWVALPALALAALWVARRRRGRR